MLKSSQSVHTLPVTKGFRGYATGCSSMPEPVLQPRQFRCYADVYMPLSPVYAPFLVAYICQPPFDAPSRTHHPERITAETTSFSLCTIRRNTPSSPVGDLHKCTTNHTLHAHHTCPVSAPKSSSRISPLLPHSRATPRTSRGPGTGARGRAEMRSSPGRPRRRRGGGRGSRNRRRPRPRARPHRP